MSILPLDPQELARRLDVLADALTIPHLESTLNVAASMLDPRCDSTKVNAYPEAYTEAVYQLAVKVWDSATRGVVGLDAQGTFELSPQATSGLYRAVLGVLQPVAKQGGVIVG